MHRLAASLAAGCGASIACRTLGRCRHFTEHGRCWTDGGRPCSSFAAATDVILEPGDAVFNEDDVVHTARGADDEETVAFGTLVLTSGEPLLMPAEMEMGAMPTP